MSNGLHGDTKASAVTKRALIESYGAITGFPPHLMHSKFRNNEDGFDHYDAVISATMANQSVLFGLSYSLHGGVLFPLCGELRVDVDLLSTRNNTTRVCWLNKHDSEEIFRYSSLNELLFGECTMDSGSIKISAGSSHIHRMSMVIDSRDKGSIVKAKQELAKSLSF